MAPRLKVFCWSDGFHAFSVAASSRAKALAAWGMERDIFASGLAREITQGADFEAALSRPGEVIARGLAVDLGEIAPRPRPKTGTGDKKTKKAAGPSPAQREKVRKLEAEVKALKLAQAAERRKLEAEAARLAREQTQLASRQETAMRTLRRRLEAARRSASS